MEKFYISKKQLEEDFYKLIYIKNIAKKYEVSGWLIAKFANKYNICYKKSAPGGSKRKYFVNDNYFSDLNNLNSIYWAGFLAADGCILKNKNILSLNLAEKDVDHLKLFKNDIEAENPLHYQDYKQRKINHNKTYGYSIAISSKEICCDLKNFNITTNKSKIIEFPNNLENEDQYRSFMLGYFDGDGSWSLLSGKNENHKKQICFNIVGTKQFLIEFNNNLVKYAKLEDKNYNKNITEHNGIFRLQYTGNNICPQIGRWLYKNIDNCRYLERKYNIIKYYLNKFYNIVKCPPKINLINDYKELKSKAQVGKKYKVSYPTIKRWFKKYNI